MHATICLYSADDGRVRTRSIATVDQSEGARPLGRSGADAAGDDSRTMEAGVVYFNIPDGHMSKRSQDRRITLSVNRDQR